MKKTARRQKLAHRSFNLLHVVIEQDTNRPSTVIKLAKLLEDIRIEIFPIQTTASFEAAPLTP